MAKEVESDCAVTALALPYGGRVLFAGTETGAVRGYRYPLTGEFYEVGGCVLRELMHGRGCFRLGHMGGGGLGVGTIMGGRCIEKRGAMEVEGKCCAGSGAGGVLLGTCMWAV